MDLPTVNSGSASSSSEQKFTVEENQLHCFGTATQPIIVEEEDKGGGEVVVDQLKNRAHCETDKYSLAKVAVWWDIENCAVPKGSDPNKIALNIISALRKLDYSGSVSIFAYGDTRVISSSVQHALSSTGVSLNHVPAGVKDASDKRILVDMLFWAFDNPAPANYLLISGDRDFSNALHQLRMRRYNVLLAQPFQASAVLVAAAKSVWLWTSLVNGCPPLTENEPPPPNAGQLYSNVSPREETKNKVSNGKKRKQAGELDTQNCQILDKKRKLDPQSNVGENVRSSANNGKGGNRIFNVGHADGQRSSNATHPGKNCQGTPVQRFKCGKLGRKSFKCNIASMDQPKTQFLGNKGNRADNKNRTIPITIGNNFKEKLNGGAKNGESNDRKFNMDHVVGQGNHLIRGGADSNKQVSECKPKRIYSCKKCGAVYHPGRNCKGIQFQCFKCGKLGHKSFKCGKLGHKSFKCSSKSKVLQNQVSQQFQANKGNLNNSQVSNIPAANGENIQENSICSANKAKGGDQKFNMNPPVGKEGIHSQVTTATNNATQGANNNNQAVDSLMAMDQAQATPDKICLSNGLLQDLQRVQSVFQIWR